MKKTISALIMLLVLVTVILSLSLTAYTVYLITPVVNTIENTTDGIKITWNKIPGADGYRVYRRGAGEGYWTYLETVSENEYLDENTLTGNYYRYTLRATQNNNFSNYDPDGKFIKRLDNPENFVAINKTEGIEVKWNSVEGALGYRVYRRAAGEKYWTYIKTISTNTYLDKSTASGTYYRYTARAVCGNYTSFYYSDGALLKRLADPGSLKATIRPTGVFVSWGSVNGATAYRVYRRGAGESWTYLKTVTQKYYLDTTAKSNTLYRYTVRATFGNHYSYYNAQGPLLTFKSTGFKSIINTTYAESYASINSNLLKLAELYPDMITLSTIGTSEAGNTIPVLTLGNGKKKALITGAIHAREHVTTKYLLRCIEDYCYAATTKSGALGKYNIKNLLNQYTLYIVPCTNPDGLEIVRSRLTPKSHKVQDLTEYKANYNGVDLNRNFPLAWDKINNGVNSPADYYFKGYSSGDQKETQALMNLCNSNRFEFLLSMHVRGNCLYWGDTYNTKYNGVYKSFATNLANSCDFQMTEPTTAAKGYGGGFENWFRHAYNRPGVCVELTKLKYTIHPCNNSDYADFNSFVNYDYSKYAMAAAMSWSE